MKINNREEIVTQLATILKEYTKHPRNYSTDIYLYVDEETGNGELYVDEETGNGELYEFPNPGGNSWLDDDHYTLCTIPQIFNDPMDVFFDTIDTIADALEIDKDELIRTVAEEMEVGIEDVQWYDVMYYVRKNDNLIDILTNYYDECYDEWVDDDIEQEAEIIVWEFENDSDND